MIGSNDILQTIIRQSAKGYNSWQIEPMWIAIENNEKEINRPELLPEIAPVGSHTFREVSKTIELNNDILILTNAELDIPISATLCLESHDNLFTITKAEYTVLSFHKYQSFSNYLKITLKNYGNYVPFQLEFLRIKPCLDSCLASPPFGNANGHFQNRNRSCEKDDD
jgi:hypothetical protein